jgi:hypothetical protein
MIAAEDNLTVAHDIPVARFDVCATRSEVVCTPTPVVELFSASFSAAGSLFTIFKRRVIATVSSLLLLEELVFGGFCVDV